MQEKIKTTTDKFPKIKNLSKINEKIDNMKIITVADVFGAAINRIHNGESVSALFEF